MKNRIFIYIILLLSLVMLTGCKKIEEYNETEFINYCYQISKGDIKDACIIDLRLLQDASNEDDYDHGHIHGALNFDLTKHEMSEFNTWICNLKSKKTTILLIDSGNKDYQKVQKQLEILGYKHIIAYTKGYQALKQNSEFATKIEESTGIEDCGC